MLRLLVEAYIRLFLGFQSSDKISCKTNLQDHGIRNPLEQVRVEGLGLGTKGAKRHMSQPS